MYYKNNFYEVLFSNFKITIGITLCAALILGCSSRTELKWKTEKGYSWAEVSSGYFDETGFEQMEPSDTGIGVENLVSEERIAENRHYLNGSGVAAGDVNGDGWVDLYFAQLEGPNRLYKNLGGFRFEDITGEAGLAHEGYNSTGVIFADIDGDADLDLLVTSITDKNVLYINDGEGHFELKTDSGLGESKGSTTMALADIDGDRDLDLYITNYKEKTVRDIYGPDELSLQNTVKVKDGKLTVLPPFDKYYGVIQTESRPYRNEYGEVDELYINDGEGNFKRADDLPRRFLNQQGEEEGLSRDWGLTAKFQDINGDGLPDLYVCNDFWTPDRIWINQGKGIFKALSSYAIRNLSFSSMGVDFSDINRDGSIDLFVTEMLSSEHQQRMRQLSDYLEPLDGRPQYNRNSLYLNRGDHTFAEISYFSGLEATEWSWDTNFLDMDLDGYEDLIITTGHAYDYQDLDTQIKMNEQTDGNKQILQYPPLELTNKMFRNNRDLTFSDKTRDWGFGAKDLSLGSALADLDNDGDMDMAVSRLNQLAGVYENTAGSPRIAVRLKGRPPNTQGIGAKIELKGGPVTQRKEVVSGGNYVSGSDPMVVFAADKENENHILTVDWQGGKQSKIDHVQANRIYSIEEPAEPAQEAGAHPETVAKEPLFEDISGRIGHRHHENTYDDFKVRPLLPVKLSQQGPGIAWIDFDRDSDDDLFIGTGKSGKTGIFENKGEGRFEPVQMDIFNTKAPGDQTSIIGWAEEDHTNLMVGNANYEQGSASVPSAFQYVIDQNHQAGKGGIPGILSTTGHLAVADYDGDGDIDLFVGGRFNPGQYPSDATSRLFKNENGQFLLDEINSRKLNETGLVTASVFTDYDQDGDQDLLMSREWDSLLLFENENAIYRDVSSETGLDSLKGWWNGIATGDFNNDGRPDIVATNLGLNSVYQMDTEHPLRMYYADFNMDGRLDILEAVYDETMGSYVPRNRLYKFDSIQAALRHIKTHQQFAGLSVEGIFREDFGTVPYKELNTLAHTLFLSGEKSYTAHSLPEEAQFSAAFYAGVSDFDNDGNEDIFISQNQFAFPQNVPRLDAGRGLWLQGNGKGEFKSISGNQTGIKVYGEQRGAALSDFNKDGKVDLAVSQNGSSTKLYINKGKKPGLRVLLTGPDENKNAVGSSIRLVYKNGRKGPRREVQVGSGYLSQNSFIQVMGKPDTPEMIEVTWFDGTKKNVTVSKHKRDYLVTY